MASINTSAPEGNLVGPVLSLSRRDGAIQEIRRAVVRGWLKPGDKLTEVQLSQMLNVSRPTIREALNQLSQEGLLVQEPYRGLRVATVDSEQILDIANTRQALDMLAVDGILDDPSGSRMDAVRQAWTEFSQVEDDPDPLLRHEAHIAFHRRIWAASGNSLLLRLWPVVEAHITIALACDQAVRSDPERAKLVHHHLVDALLSGDRAAIEKAFESHTIGSAHELIELMRKEGAA
ncbi:GntR family transcriptional regulator [Zafaria cholistanensis]|uniref:GntR family transcriptional regulator n=1 Tax=Zafaria cholistanensis TaxID=1682741 RepID=A0A5A7NUY6_9MICC|nr:GntR family transcriptional regulator [Zafaria cholistanensis]GER23741.1 GntR family transcriptional regulator [Zafaria cholistanensis]